MITVTIDTSDLEKGLLKELKGFESPSSVNSSKMLREIATTVCGLQLRRIHTNGLKADGNRIGVYSPEYLKRRGKRGFTNDPKVVLAFNQDMQNDYGIGVTDPIDLQDSGIGLGWTIDPDTNDKKRFHLENKYGDIYGLSKEETEAVEAIANHHVQQALDRS